ncbi:TAFII55 protein conserved region-domain-containing protein [Hypoxylon trugodes]|uniref:TAFII55 protein conserved region-domain-containing protein n=1 Tax=Hypoxylon trugodes TaxID=326681 RepID=UPI0021A21E83|nr:TAFII55 protein conserved region-domain-containing protein [Hypoxylon trugodes]KAI1390129.1 TAFII55 protein conserved region-domain-containing protein [Hypoxylon trugodes]
MSSINVKPTLKIDTAQSMPPPSENPRPILKLNTGSRQSSFSGDVGTPTPSGENRKIKIKLSSQPSTPAPASAAPTPGGTKSKAGRMSKPTAKVIESKKRHYDSDEDQPLSVSRQESKRPSKAIKLKTPGTPIGPHKNPGTPISSIKFKPRGEPIEHLPGEAYDSEASDRETDPVREHTFILRVMPGEPTEFLRKALADGIVGLTKQNGGADFGVQFLDSKQRRAMVTIDGRHYAAVLVHLPTITEAMKTWDRKNMMKNSDVSEMLLCFAEVKNENEAKTIALPHMVTKDDFKWPHGLTPPMHDAVHRRFRKTISEKQWQSSAAQVTKLLEDDAAALESTVDFLQDEDGFADTEEEEEDAEGEADDYFGDQMDAQVEDVEDAEDDAEVLAAMEAELAEEGPQQEESVAAATPAVQTEAPTPMAVDANTPAPAAEEVVSEEDEDEEEEDDDDDEEEEDVDEEQLVAERERKEKLDEIEHLQRSLDDTLRQMSEVTAPILKKRIISTKENLEKEIAVKKAALGLVDED